MSLSRPTLHAVLPSSMRWALHDMTASRAAEQAGLAMTAPHVLMQRAGLAVARLALAVAPLARQAWVACGPGNNGGDGLVAAMHLHRAGLSVQVRLIGDPERLPDDARDALARARQAGVPVALGPGAPPERCDLAIDALLGLGATRAPSAAIATAIERLNTCGAPVVAVDLPSGLHAERGVPLGSGCVQAAHTLALLTLKPGLFTGQGRDAAGRVWLDTLGCEPTAVAPATAWLSGPQDVATACSARRHAQHKGSFGDVVAIGGAPGMGGAVRLAARAALAAGAGRVYRVTLDPARRDEVDDARPELMPRALAEMLQPAALAHATVVCGCGGGADVRDCLPPVLHHAGRLVLDADALNAIAAEPALMHLLRARAARGRATVITPHPLEAARLLGRDTAGVQDDRPAAALALSDQLQCTVVLKGSGTVVTAPDRPVMINPTGNARLASAGTGDVLAGWLAGAWACNGDDLGHAAAVAAVWLHGRAAECAAGHPDLPLRAADLIDAMAQAMPDPLGRP